MPRYFFHVQDGQDFPDLEGTELPDLAAARAQAVQFAGSLLADQPETFWASGEWHLQVTDEAGLSLFQLTFFATEAPVVKGS